MISLPFFFLQLQCPDPDLGLDPIPSFELHFQGTVQFWVWKIWYVQYTVATPELRADQIAPPD